jgi:hypothetical protein
MDEKLKQDSLYRKKLAEGWVRYLGEWVTIEEKIRRIQPAEATGEAERKLVIKHNDKRVFHIHHHHDNRNYTTHLHEHRHLHTGAEALDFPTENERLDKNSPRELPPEKRANRLPGGGIRKRLPGKPENPAT